MLSPRRALLIVLLAMALGTAAFGAEYKPGEVIVKYKDSFRPRASMDALYQSVGAEPILRYQGMMQGFELLSVQSDADIHDVIKQLQKDSAVAYAQPNYIVHIFPVAEQLSRHGYTQYENKKQPSFCLIPGAKLLPGCELSQGSAQFNSGEFSDDRPVLKDRPTEPKAAPDPDMSKLYGMKKIGAPEAWNIHKGDSNFLVADVDTGIDYNHEDLSYNVWRNPNPGDKHDIVGYDFVHDDGLPYDDQGHGTHTAGTIGAVGENGIGVSGVSQRVSVMAVKFLDSNGGGTTSDGIRSIDYAVTHGAKIINASWGGQADNDNNALKEAIARAESHDVLFVAAAGNDTADNDGSEASYPAAFDSPNLIAVAATDSRDKMASFSNYGKKTVHVAAPGVQILSTEPNNSYVKLSGTSMACPHVVGAAALLWSKNPSWDYKKVKQVIMDTVDLLPSLAGKTITGGRINVEKMLNSN